MLLPRDIWWWWWWLLFCSARVPKILFLVAHSFFLLDWGRPLHPPELETGGKSPPAPFVQVEEGRKVQRRKEGRKGNLFRNAVKEAASPTITEDGRRKTSDCTHLSDPRINTILPPKDGSIIETSNNIPCTSYMHACRKKKKVACTAVCRPVLLCWHCVKSLTKQSRVITVRWG